jgi:general secretion pathway protein K
MSAASPHQPETAADGFIIVAVLWILGALAALVSIYAVYVMDTAKQFALHDDRLQSEALGSAAIELTAYQLTATTAQSRPTRGAFDFHMANADIAVSFQSEAARIDLNAAPKELLAGLFIALHEAPDSAANYADRIIGWRTPPSDDQGASLPTQATDTGYAARTVRFFHSNELSLVPGLPKAVAERALPFVTVYSGRRQINVADAPAEVLAALPGITKDSLNAVLAQRRASADGQTLLQLLGPAQSFATTEGSNATRLTIRIAYDDGHRSSSEVVILPFEGGTEPYSILSWHDELEPTDARRGMASR